MSGVKINPDELEFVRTVGIGSCGEVFEALWKGTRVAVKKVFKSTWLAPPLFKSADFPGLSIDTFFMLGMLHSDSLKEFKAETHILRRLRHPNVVLFMGTCTINKNEMCIVTEFMARGSLHDVLVNLSIDLNWDLILKMVWPLAMGKRLALQFLITQGYRCGTRHELPSHILASNHTQRPEII